MVTANKASFNFPVSIKNIRIDEWGEAEVTFRIPQSHIEQATQLTMLSGRRLRAFIATNDLGGGRGKRVIEPSNA